MRRRAIAIAVFAMAGSAWGQSAQTVAGTVTTLEGTPVPDALVTLVANGATKRSTGYLLARSQADGAFTIPSVPKGDYRACVRSDASPILDPCVWGGFPVSISVAEGAAPPPVRLVVAQGIEVALRIDDPEGRLVAYEQKASHRPPLTVGVFTARKMYIPAPLVGAGATVREYRIVLPADVALRLVLTSVDFEFDSVAGGGVGGFRQDGINMIGTLKLPKAPSKAEVRTRIRPRKQG